MARWTLYSPLRIKAALRADGGFSEARRMKNKKRLLPALALMSWPALAAVQTLTSPQAPPVTASTPLPPSDIGTLQPIIVTGQQPGNGNQNQNSIQIDPQANKATYTLTAQQISTIAQGENTSFNLVLAHAPGVSDDTYGAIHFRNEDPYYRYYINGTLLPSGINGFSQDVDTRFLQSVTLKVGALPAYYTEGNYGIVDITTKSGAALNGGAATFYGGSFETIHPSFSYGGTSHGTDFYFTGSYLHDDLGLENPTPNSTAIHDETNQYRGMTYLSHQFDDAGRFTFVFSGQDSDYQIPNTPNQTPAFNFNGSPNPPVFVNSTSLNETQNEQTYYGFVAYQQNFDDWSFQISQVDRDSTVKFNPDINGDLLYNGVAAAVKEYNTVNGIQADFTWQAATDHKVSYGVIADTQGAGANNFTYVYPTDVAGNPNGPLESFQDDHSIRAYDWGIYAQDEWKVTDKLMINYGARFEQVKGYTDESQLSPRINAVYQVDKDTAIHGGYARYFDPPQLLNVAGGNVRQFNNTTNAADQDTDDPIKVEKSHYFDLGVTHNFMPGLTTGVDAYYKIDHDQIDDGQFGAANISAPYNFNTASMYGVDFSVDYTRDGFSAYGNFSAADSWAHGIASSQFEFDADELAAINSNNVRLDQSVFYTASAGAAYTFLDTTVHVDALYGDGIRAGFVNINKLEPYCPVNIGVEHVFQLPKAQELTVRFDILNVFDQGYILNDGTGIGEGAVKYGNRRGFYGGMSYSF
jgi:hypothetical protein